MLLTCIAAVQASQDERVSELVARYRSIATIQLLGLLLSLYFLPTVVAIIRKRSKRVPIFLVNVLLGVTFIGWIRQTCKLRRNGFFCQLTAPALKDFDALKFVSAYPEGAFIEKQISRGVYEGHLGWARCFSGHFMRHVRESTG